MATKQTRKQQLAVKAHKAKQQAAQQPQKFPRKDRDGNKFEAVFPRVLMTEPRIDAFISALAISNLALDVNLHNGRKANTQYKNAQDMVYTVASYYGSDLPDNAISAEKYSFRADVYNAITAQGEANWNFHASAQVWGDTLQWVLAHVQSCALTTNEKAQWLLGQWTNLKVKYMAQINVMPDPFKAGVYAIRVIYRGEPRDYLLYCNNNSKRIMDATVDEVEFEEVDFGQWPPHSNSF